MSALNGRRPGPQSLLLEGHFQRRGPFLSLSLVISKATMQIQKVLSVKTAPGGALPYLPVTHLCHHSRGGVTEDIWNPRGEAFVCHPRSCTSHRGCGHLPGGWAGSFCFVTVFLSSLLSPGLSVSEDHVCCISVTVAVPCPQSCPSSMAALPFPLTPPPKKEEKKN